MMNKMIWNVPMVVSQFCSLTYIVTRAMASFLPPISSSSKSLSSSLLFSYVLADIMI